MRLILIGLLLPVFLIAAARAQETTFIGLGPTYTFPLDTFGVTNEKAVGGTLLYGSRKFCQVWFGLRLSFTQNVAKDSRTRLLYENQMVLAPEARYFFAEPTVFPLYAVADLQLSSIAGTDSASGAGLGAAGGIGYLLLYEDDCCNWFLDLSAQYQAPNLILRSELRPILSSIVLALTFNLSI